MVSNFQVATHDYLVWTLSTSELLASLESRNLICRIRFVGPIMSLSARSSVLHRPPVEWKM
jgi:hypothetical protein